MLSLLAILLFVFLVLFPFGQLTKVPLAFLSLPEVHLYLTDVVLFLFVVGWGIWRLFFHKKKYSLPPLAKPIFLFAIIGGVSLMVSAPLFAGREVLVGFLYLCRWLAYAGLYFALWDLKGKWSWLRRDWSCFLMIVGSMIGGFALLQYLFWPNLKALEVLQYDPHFYRAAGTFIDPGFTGLILVLTLILVTFRIWSEKKQKRWFMILWLFLFVILALTYSRASWLVFFLSMTLLAFSKRSWRFLVLIIGLLAFTWLVIPQPAGEGGKLIRTYTIQARWENSQQAITIIKQRPFLGVGFNTLRYYQKQKGFLAEENWQLNQAGAGIDNSWLFVLATSGLLGFLAYLWLWGKALKISQGNFLVLASLMTFMVHAFFINSLFYPWAMAWFWSLLALGVKVKS
ncbi:O-antigen ligase family protein [Candidatus Shapirobacteria bacterium]|nr:O-antigen ligase family protein [Candidatus Shapirobacteria bacterium]